MFLEADSDYYLLCGLERYNKKEGKYEITFKDILYYDQNGNSAPLGHKDPVQLRHQHAREGDREGRQPEGDKVPQA